MRDGARVTRLAAGDGEVSSSTDRPSADGRRVYDVSMIAAIMSPAVGTFSAPV